ncbi:MAG: histidine kinase [Alistipes sp.]|nr:histidine kinase [Alistipes sp.]
MRPQANKPIVGENLLYFLVWAMALLVPILNSKMMSEEHVYLSNILLVWSKLLPYIIIFVINNALLAPKFFFQKRYLAYVVISFVMLTAIFYPIEHYQDELRLLEYPDGTNYFIHGRASFTDLAWYWNVLLGLFMMGANCSIKFIFRSMQAEQKMVAMERHALQAEMDYLKYQINPHFFMNTLNNIHAMIDIDSEAAKEIVIELSKMMRYVLYDSEKQQTNLEQEVQFTENYVELMRVRYPSDVDVRFDVQRPLPVDAKVPPLLPIVFVENAFKHGVSYNRPSFVHIRLHCEDGKAVCEVRNSRHKNMQVEKGGVGLENVRKRLDLLFGKDFELLTDDSREDEYSVKLSIPMTYDKVHSHR